MRKAIFLGGACGETTWRRDVTIPMLEAAGISFHNPQLAPGAWTEAYEIEDMRTKAEAEVLLVVISEATRGVAGVAEVAYLIASGRPLAMCLRMIPGASPEIDDLNRGRIFLQTMAAEHDVPVFATEKDAAEYAISLVTRRRSGDDGGPCPSSACRHLVRRSAICRGRHATASGARRRQLDRPMVAH